MTPEQLAEIRARAEAATSGPWDVYDGWVGLDGEALNPFFRGIVAVLSEDGEGNNILVRTRSDDEEAFEYPANAAFIAHARTDIPALLDYIEELQWVIRKVGDCIAHPEDTKEVGGTLCAQCMYLVHTLISKEPTNA